MPTARRTPAAGTKPTTKPKFSVSALKPEVEHEPFPFEHGGKDWVMVHSQDVDVWQINNLVTDGGGATNTDLVAAMFRAALGDQWAEFSSIPMAAWQLEALSQAYGEHCGVDLGESEGSATS
jgi:hypothetical protein